MSEIILYTTEDGIIKINVQLENETVWLTQKQLVELYQTAKSTVSEHIKNIYTDEELTPDATVRKIRTVQNEGKREVERALDYYNLDMIIALGYRINSKIATQFRIWATQRLKEYIVKGFTMDDERLKNLGGGGYWKELLQRIRDIQASEKVFYQQVLDIYATSIDYDPKADVSIEFLKKYKIIIYGLDDIFGLPTAFKRCCNRKKLFKRKRITGIRANCFWLSGFCRKTSRT